MRTRWSSSEATSARYALTVAAATPRSTARCRAYASRALRRPAGNAVRSWSVVTLAATSEKPGTPRPSPPGSTRSSARAPWRSAFDPSCPNCRYRGDVRGTPARSRRHHPPPLGAVAPREPVHLQDGERGEDGGTEQTGLGHQLPHRAAAAAGQRLVHPGASRRRGRRSGAADPRRPPPRRARRASRSRRRQRLQHVVGGGDQLREPLGEQQVAADRRRRTSPGPAPPSRTDPTGRPPPRCSASRTADRPRPPPCRRPTRRAAGCAPGTGAAPASCPAGTR